MSIEDEQKKKRQQALKFLKKEFDVDQPILDDRKKEKRRQRNCAALRRILRNFMPFMKVKMIYEKMVLWCDSQDPPKNPTIFLLSNWCEHRLEWDNEKKSNSNDEGDKPDERRKKSKEFLEKIRQRRRAQRQDA